VAVGVVVVVGKDVEGSPSLLDGLLAAGRAVDTQLPILHFLVSFFFLLVVVYTCLCACVRVIVYIGVLGKDE
jgi:hypothetical protein